MPPSASWKRPFLVVDGAGEGAFAMAEKLGFEEVFRQGAAIDGDEGGELAAAVEMEGAGDQFLAGAAFAQDEDGAVGVGHALDHLEDVLHLGGIADELVELVFFLELLFEVDVLGNGVVVGEGAADAEAEIIHLEGLLQIIEGALFHRVHRRLDGGVGGDDDDGGGGIEGAGLLQNFQAVGAGFVQIQVGDDQFGTLRLRGFRRRRCNC